MSDHRRNAFLRASARNDIRDLCVFALCVGIAFAIMCVVVFS